MVHFKQLRSCSQHRFLKFVAIPHDDKVAAIVPNWRKKRGKLLVVFLSFFPSLLPGPAVFDGWLMSLLDFTAVCMERRHVFVICMLWKRRCESILSHLHALAGWWKPSNHA